jgi:flagella basal body P-ring formation protein FlgA
MIRSFLLLAVLLPTGALAATPVTLKASPVDADGSVTLADLFDGASSTLVVGAGPKPGGSVIFDAARVQTIARSAGLSWANPAGVRRIAVRHAAPASVATDSTPVASGAPTGAVEVLTFARSLNAGAVIAPDDLAWAAVARPPADAPDDAEAAIGLAVRKPVRAGTAVSARDLTAARVINKNDTVSVRYRAGPVSLILQGKALTSAAVGETVQVLNPGSKSVVEAVAAAPGLALVGPGADSLKLRGPAALASR